MKTSTLPAPLPAWGVPQPALEREQPAFLEALDTRIQTDDRASDLADTPTELEPALPQQRGAWKVFVSTFATIFLAEMGDKTQIATLLMTAESHSPWVVFLGAGSALIATSFLGVLLGRWLASRLSPKTLQTSAGLILLFISLSLLWDVLH